ncbi:hypothetical protein BH10PSE1_BH10PSE1_09190 [soil metagenome]
MSRVLGFAEGPAFLHLMKRYVIDYTNSHDQAVTVDIMEPDYALRMGEHRVVGRDSEYFAATRKQMDQFPGLMLTVHEIWTSGQRLMMRFSEHGASLRHGGAIAAWGGIGLYGWNGSRLTSNFVEQDYASRALQLATGRPNAVEAPAPAPWDGETAAPDLLAEQTVRDWLASGDPTTAPEIVCDDQWTGTDQTALLDQASITINSLFSCGPRVAFHITQEGFVRPECDPARVGQRVRLNMAGIVHLNSGTITAGRIVRNRLELQRTLSVTAK